MVWTSLTELHVRAPRCSATAVRWGEQKPCVSACTSLDSWANSCKRSRGQAIDQLRTTDRQANWHQGPRYIHHIASRRVSPMTHTTMCG